jgi:methylenetetrahydrofolate dehydrogenase (NADP+)/methenyltetrahydrofolate cyclohydrolase
MIPLDGKAIAASIVKRLKNQPPPKKFFGAVLVGQDPASVSFLAQKEKTAKAIGVDFRLYKFPENIKNDPLRQEVGKIASHKTCGTVIIQLPLPAHLNRHYVLNAVPREKDVEVLSERSLGAFYAGRNPVVPPGVAAVEEILRFTKFQLEGKVTAVVGPGLLIGKPTAVWLMGKVRELFVLDRGADFSVLKSADLVVSGVGKAGLFSEGMLKKGASVIDFGCSMEYVESEKGKGKIAKIRGDFTPPSPLSSRPVSHVTSPMSPFYTPTPGGTGPVLVAKLFENFYILHAAPEKKK